MDAIIKNLIPAEQPTTSELPQLSWSPWVSFSGGDFRQVPRGVGLYRVRVAGQSALAYIGQTGRDLRARLNDLRRNTLAVVMPFNDPHTAAPSLWAWRQAEGFQLECSAARYDGDQRTRLALECWLLWRHRVVHGVSCLCNYGHFHGAYVKSGDRRTGRRGGRRPEVEANAAAAACTAVLTRQGSPTDSDWRGLAWTPWASLRSLQGITGAGLYRIADGAGELLYIGESRALPARLGSHARHGWQV